MYITQIQNLYAVSQSSKLLYRSFYYFFNLYPFCMCYLFHLSIVVLSTYLHLLYICHILLLLFILYIPPFSLFSMSLFIPHLSNSYPFHYSSIYYPFGILSILSPIPYTNHFILCSTFLCLLSISHIFHMHSTFPP